MLLPLLLLLLLLARSSSGWSVGDGGRDGGSGAAIRLPVPRVIVLAPGSSANEALAARELSRLLPPLLAQTANTTGSAVPILTSSTVPHFAVGWGAAMALGARGWNGTAPSSADPFAVLGNDSFSILSVTCQQPQPHGCNLPVPHASFAGSIAVSSCRGCVRGTLYGVYELLRCVGVKFLAPDETLYPSTPLRQMPVLNLTFTPSFEYRDILGWPVMNSKPFAAQMGLNGPSVWDLPDPSFELSAVRYASPPGFVHTALRLLDDVNGTHSNEANVPPALRKAHPEWFSLEPGFPCAKGSDPTGTYKDGCQLCWSDPGLQQYLLAQARIFLRAEVNANATVLSISNMDNGNKCKRPAELAVVAEEGSDAGPILRAVNFIAEGIASEFPHVLIDLLAYSYAQFAPKKTMAKPNVIVRMALGQNNGAPASDDTNRNFTRIVQGWGVASRRLYLWSYDANFCNFLMPYPVWYHLAANSVFFHSLGVRGLFSQSSYSNPGDVAQKAAMGPSTDILNNYLLARSMWNASLDPRALMEDWVLGYHGPVGGPLVQQFMALIAGNVAPGFDGCFGTGLTVHASYLPPAAVLESGHLFAQGLAVLQRQQNRKKEAPEAAQKYASRLRAAAIQVWDVALLRWSELQDFAAAHAVAWPFGTKLQCLELFTQTWNETNMVKLNEMDGAGRDLMCSLPCYRRLVLNLSVVRNQQLAVVCHGHSLRRYAVFCRDATLA